LNSDQAYPGSSLQMTLWLLSGCFRSWPYRFGRVRPGRSRRVCDHFVITKAPPLAILGDQNAEPRSRIYDAYIVYTERVAKHLVDLDEEALSAAQAELGTTTIKDTVNKALERATSSRHRRVASALDILAEADLEDRAEAWR